jgi:hypothetical protein
MLFREIICVNYENYWNAELLNVTTCGAYRYHWALTVKLLKFGEGEYKKTLILNCIEFSRHNNKNKITIMLIATCFETCRLLLC